MAHFGRLRAASAVAVTLTLVLSAPAAAHPEHNARTMEEFRGEGIADDRIQHGPESGHLPDVNENVTVVGKAGVSAPPSTSGMTGRVADVAAYGNYAYLTAFRGPECTTTGGSGKGGGFWVVDISNPASPAQVGFMPTTDYNYAGEGADIITPASGAYAGRQLFIHQNETCPNAPAAAPGTRGGINIWDVTNPLVPVLLKAHAGDYSNASGTNANSTHSAFAWNSHVDGKVYVVLVDNVEFTDVDIMDITDPTNPVMVNDTLDLVAQFGVNQPAPTNLTSIFSHDMMVYRKGDRYVMNVSYWDGGYVLLDVTNPTPGNVTLIAETDYAPLDEERLARGHEWAPEGNGHQSEFSPDFRYLIGTDEDFNPYRVVATITSGPYVGTEYVAINASGTPAITPGSSLSGTPTWVGLACAPLTPVTPGTGAIALVERGTCSFQAKLDNVTAAGYSAGLVFNSTGGCQALVSMLAAGSIPFMFVTRLTGLQLLQVAGVNSTSACTTASPSVGSAAASTSIQSVFDGWGYVRLFRSKLPSEPGTTGSLAQVDTYTIPEAQSSAYAFGFGALSVHEVAMDPRPGTNLAYLSYYSGGIRVLSYGDKGLTEVGTFIDEGGSNFWGVEVHKHPNGKYYVLASDRDYGLYILQYNGKIPGGDRGKP